MFSWFRHKLLGRTSGIEHLFNRILEGQEKIMGQLEDLNAKLTTAINDATNRVAAILAKDASDLAAAKAAGQAPAQSTLDSLAANVARLQSLGADPTNPIPAEPGVTTSSPAPVGDPAPATSPAPTATDTTSSSSSSDPSTPTT